MTIVVANDNADTELYVHNQTSNGDGSLDDPFNNFIDANRYLDQGSDGFGKIILKQGTYSSETYDDDNRPDWFLPGGGNNIILTSLSQNPNDTIIDANGSNWIIAGNNLKIEHLTLSGLDTEYNGVTGSNRWITADADSIVLRNVRIIDNNLSQDLPLIDITSSSADVIIENSYFENNSNDRSTGVNMVSAGDSGNVYIRNSEFRNIDYSSFSDLFGNFTEIKDSFFYDTRYIAGRVSANNSVFHYSSYISPSNRGWAFGKGDFTNCILYNVAAGSWATSSPGTIKNSILMNSVFESHTNSNNYWNSFYNVHFNVV